MRVTFKIIWLHLLSFHPSPDLVRKYSFYKESLQNWNDSRVWTFFGTVWLMQQDENGSERVVARNKRNVESRIDDGAAFKNPAVYGVSTAVAAAAAVTTTRTSFLRVAIFIPKRESLQGTALEHAQYKGNIIIGIPFGETAVAGPRFIFSILCSATRCFLMRCAR